MKGPLLAVRPEGNGELDRKAVIWKHETGTPDTCCPVVAGNLLFFVSDNGIARCFDAYTGHQKWDRRIPGDYKASPLAASGRIYFLNTSGLCTVVAASARFEQLAQNQLDDETLASPAISDGRIYLRGRKSLYCVSK
jgi:outer membrane protein assembly factor BamB